MNSDVFLVVGIAVAAFSVPSIISAFSEARPPRVAAISIVVGGALIVAAVMTRPGGYRFDEVPAAFVRVMDRVVN